MTIPISVDRKLKSASDGIVRAERNFVQSRNVDTLGSDLTDALIALHLSLDRTQNKIWEIFKSQDSGNKPNIYFPMVANREKLKARLQKDQLGDLEIKNPKIYTLIASVQPFTGADWWKRMHGLSQRRHEQDIELAQVTQSGIGIGRGQSLYIDHLIVHPDGSSIFKGNAWNELSGRPEPVRFDLTSTETVALRELGIEAIPFARECLNATKILVGSVFREMK